MIILSKKDEDINIYEMVHNSKIPILILDNRWQQLFPEEQKPVTIKRLETNLKNAVKRQARLGSELKELQALKKKLMSEIVQNMEEVDSDLEKEEKRRKKLDKSQKLILDINEKISKCMHETDEIPDKIKKANEALMIASVKLCYEKMGSNEQDIKVITEWIDRTRVELKRQVLIKQEKQEANAKIYSYLHDILGPKYMEMFDRNDGNVEST